MPDADRPVPWRRRLALFALGPAAWLLQLAARASPELVERLYARGVYPVIRSVTGTLTGWFGWSLVELVLVLGVGIWLVRAIRDADAIRRGRRSARNVVAGHVSAAMATVGLLVAWAILSWGLNYARQPFAVSAGLDASPPSAAELTRVAERLAVEAAALRATVPEDDRGVMRPLDDRRDPLARAADAFVASDGTYGPLIRGRVSRAKAVRLPILPWLNISGVFSMFTSEPNVTTEPPPATVLASACHELAHQLGWAREEEAEFVGYLACRRHPDADLRYAATQSALRYTWGALRRADPGAAMQIAEALDPGTRRDWVAASEFWARYDTRLGEVSERVNDAYLKSQGQSAGIASYGLMVELLVADLRREERAG